MSSDNSLTDEHSDAKGRIESNAAPLCDLPAPYTPSCPPRLVFNNKDPARATEATLCILGGALQKLWDKSDCSTNPMLDFLTTSHILMLTDRDQAYSIARGKTGRVDTRVNGSEWASEGYGIYVKLKLSVYEAGSSGKPLRNEGACGDPATDFQTDIITLPGNQTLPQLALSNAIASTLLMDAITVDLRDEIQRWTIWISDTGIECRWCRMALQESYEVFNSDDISLLEAKANQGQETAVIKGELTIQLDPPNGADVQTNNPLRTQLRRMTRWLHYP